MYRKFVSDKLLPQISSHLNDMFKFYLILFDKAGIGGHNQ